MTRTDQTYSESGGIASLDFISPTVGWGEVGRSASTASC